MRSLLLIYLGVFFFTSVITAQSFFALPAINDADQFNSAVVRTATLLHAATASNPVEVRILVYGQSISVQDWWKEVKKYVETRFPFARIQFINKAIGGFSAERLKLTVENDVVSFYPDLVLFHDYGSETDYEKIIQVIRSRTTAEIILQTDHMAVQNQEWHDKHSAVWMPALAKKYGLAIIDVRKVWKEYLLQNKLEIKDLLSDGVHLNQHGNYLMASIVNKYFESLQQPQVKSSFYNEYLEGTDFLVQGRTIKKEIYGNRIDLVFADKSFKPNKLSVQVDGGKPNLLSSCFYNTRPAFDTTSFFLKKIGQPLAIKLGGNVKEEEWKMTITSVDSIKQQVGFLLRGSITGEDGVGSSDSMFRSISGAIAIEPANWFRAKEFAGFPWLLPGDVLTWKVKRMCHDKLTSKAAATTTILQGIENKKYLLKLRGKGTKQVKAIRVYKPPLT